MQYVLSTMTWHVEVQSDPWTPSRQREGEESGGWKGVGGGEEGVGGGGEGAGGGGEGEGGWGGEDGGEQKQSRLIEALAAVQERPAACPTNDPPR